MQLFCFVVLAVVVFLDLAKADCGEGQDTCGIGGTYQCDSPSDTTCSATCTNGDCTGLTIESLSGESLAVNCGKGSQGSSDSCRGLTIRPASDSNVALTCRNDVCTSVTVHGASGSNITVDCQGSDSCESLTVIDAEESVTMSCGGESSCADLSITMASSDEGVYCTDPDTCRDVSVTCTGSGSCVGVTVTGSDTTNALAVQCGSGVLAIAACQSGKVSLTANGANEIDYSCFRASCGAALTIDGTLSNLVYIEAYATSPMQDATVDCPKDGTDANGCVFVSESVGGHNITFRAVEGLANDLDITCAQGTNGDCFSDAKVYCTEGFGSSCDLTWSGSSASCDNIQGDENCEFYTIQSEISTSEPPRAFETSSTMLPEASTSEPTVLPTTLNPTSNPSNIPSLYPTIIPSFTPSNEPTFNPTSSPSNFPSSEPSHEPSLIPTFEPSDIPTILPSDEPSSIPSENPSNEPTSRPSRMPTVDPTDSPTSLPATRPTGVPSGEPSNAPSDVPTPQGGGSGDTVTKKDTGDDGEDPGIIAMIVIFVLIFLGICGCCIYIYFASKKPEYEDENKYPTFTSKFQAAASDASRQLKNYISSKKSSGGDVVIKASSSDNKNKRMKPKKLEMAASATVTSAKTGSPASPPLPATTDSPALETVDEKNLYTAEEEDDMKQEEYVTPGGPDGPNLDDIDLSESDDQAEIISNPLDNNVNNVNSAQNMDAMANQSGYGNDVDPLHQLQMSADEMEELRQADARARVQLEKKAKEEDERLALQLSQQEILDAIQQQQKATGRN